MNGSASVTTGSLALHPPTWFMPTAPAGSLPELLDRPGLSWQSGSASAAVTNTYAKASFVCNQTVDVKCDVANVALSSAVAAAALRAVTPDLYIYEFEPAACVLDGTSVQYEVSAGCSVTGAQVLATASLAQPSQVIGKVPPWTYAAAGTGAYKSSAPLALHTHPRARTPLHTRPHTRAHTRSRTHELTHAHMLTHTCARLHSHQRERARRHKYTPARPHRYTKPAIMWRYQRDVALDPNVHLTLYSSCPRGCRTKRAQAHTQTHTHKQARARTHTCTHAGVQGTRRAFRRRTWP
jgi:hypothetical protein